MVEDTKHLPKLEFFVSPSYKQEKTLGIRIQKHACQRILMSPDDVIARKTSSTSVERFIQARQATGAKITALRKIMHWKYVTSLGYFSDI